MNREKVVVYPGTFDPITNGHVDIATRATKIFDKVIIAIPKISYHKEPLFSVEERLEIAKIVFKDNPKIEVLSFEGLLVDFVKSTGAIAIVRGLRAISDFEYELQIALMNMEIKNVETIFFMTSEENMFVSSSIIKEVAMLGGNVSNKVPSIVYEKLKEKFSKTPK
ncbi:MAG: pantetheine-phosphate adenylyltransferase [Brevinematales bacterium]|nr:pantetheine-phosphate adenylyltransferase [Brevinematales bacterium]